MYYNAQNDVFIWEIILFYMVLYIVMGPGITWLPRWYHVDTTLIPRWDKTILKV